jgi:hypothetical protein
MNTGKNLRILSSIGALVGVFLAGVLPAIAQTEGEAEAIVIGDVALTRVHHDENLLPDREHAGFSALLYDAAGNLVLHDGDKTWLYTTGLFEAPTGGQRDWYGKWVSHVREFNARTLVSGEKQVALGLSGDDQWAVIHNVVKVSDDLFVAFYSTNGGVRAAVSDRPDGMFEADPEFQIAVTEPWEDEGGEEDSLESNGAHVLIEDTETALTLWLGYDSYHVDQTAGQLGWAKVRIDKAARTVELVEKHPDNPLPLLPEGYIAARAGGNLSGDIRFGDQHVFLYYTRPDQQQIMLTAALSPDPLFQEVSDIVEIEPPLGDEEVIEKFEAYMLDDILYVIYENKLASGHWGTGIRLYEISEQP